MCRLLAVDAASVKVIASKHFSATAVIIIETGIITGIVPPLIIIAFFPLRISVLIIVAVSASVAVIVRPVSLIIVASVSRVILSIIVSCVIIVLGVICIIFTIGTLVCSVEIFRIALP